MDKVSPKINSTGLRLFVLLQLLMQKDQTKAEIFEYFKNNYKNLNISTDILRLDINTLRTAGFDIVAGEKKDNYKYSLKWNPLKINFDKNEINILNQIKTLIIQSADLDKIMDLYNLFEKISKFINDENTKERFLNFGYFHNVNFNLLRKLIAYCEKQQCIEILYNSPNSGEKNISLKCYKIIHDKNTNKIHLWCFANGYNEGKLAYFRVENIIKISKNSIPEDIKFILPEKCKITLKGKSMEEYKQENGEKIIKKTKDYVKFETEILTEFHFVQRILNYGEDCIWVDNANIRKRILEKLYEIKKIYE